MAKLFLNDDEAEINDGDNILEAIEELGVPIGCTNGVCGTCEIEVLEGMDNLSPMTAEEEELGMEGARRLGCQCKITGGDVKATF